MIKNKLEQLEEKRKRLQNVGLLEETDSVRIKKDQTLAKDTIRVLTLFIEDAEEKLSIFDELETKINVLREIINKQFTFKDLYITKKDGFRFLLDDNEETVLSADYLSSGEQHQLVMNYELLFKTEEKSLILIDEPEISLHISWQKEYLKHLGEIAKIANLDILIATHSPQIISDRWDLTIPLEDKET